MKAIILAAGRGSRMCKLTEDKPKCLSELAGKSLLQWQIDSLQAAGIAEIGIVKGYRKEKLDLPSFKTFENARWQETNMVMSLASASEWLEQDVSVVTYSDIVFSSDAAELIKNANDDIVITYDPLWLNLWSKRFDDPLLDAETFKTDKDGYLTEIGSRAKSLDEIKGQYMGLLRFTPDGWALVSRELAELSPVECDRLDMTSLLKRLISKGVKIRALPIESEWYEVDSESDLKLYNSIFASKDKV